MRASIGVNTLFVDYEILTAGIEDSHVVSRPKRLGKDALLVCVGSAAMIRAIRGKAEGPGVDNF